MKYHTAIIALIVGAITTSASANNKLTLTKEAFLETASARIEKAGLPGVAVAVVRPNGEYWSHGFGYADIATQKPMTEDTVIAIASISKTVAGVAAMQLVEKGDVVLDGDINNHLSFKVENPKQHGKTITLRHALTHTTGIVDYDPIYNSDIVYHYGGDNPIALDVFTKDYLTPSGKYYSAENNFSDTAPGSNFAYSNIVFGLVGTLIEHVSEQAFNDYTREHIFKPLGMDASGWMYHEVNADDLGTQYVRADGAYRTDQLQGDIYGGWQAVKPHGLASYPDGGLRTSVSDLSRFLATIMNGGTYKGIRILSKETVAKMLTAQTFEVEGKTQYVHDTRGVAARYLHSNRGLSFGIYDVNGVLVKGHTGSDPGVNTYMFFNPETDAGVIFFTNGSIHSEEQRNLVESIIADLLENTDAFVP